MQADREDQVVTEKGGILRWEEEGIGTSSSNTATHYVGIPPFYMAQQAMLLQCRPLEKQLAVGFSQPSKPDSNGDSAKGHLAEPVENPSMDPLAYWAHEPSMAGPGHFGPEFALLTTIQCAQQMYLFHG